MDHFYKNVSINYEFNKVGNNLLIFLPGWEANISLMKPLAKRLVGDFSFLFIDFPPFGKSSEPSEPWILDDYVNLVQEIIEKTKVENNFSSISLIGHSFGGRVSLKLATKIKVDRLILLASAGLKPRFSLKTQLKIVKYKILKKFNPSKASKLGSSDYKKLTPVMKKTFVNIVNENLSKDCKNINSKTLIIFGSKDCQTPLYMGKKLKKLIENSELIIIKNSDHFAYLKNLSFVSFAILNFLLTS